MTFEVRKMFNVGLAVGVFLILTSTIGCDRDESIGGGGQGGSGGSGTAAAPADSRTLLLSRIENDKSSLQRLSKSLDYVEAQTSEADASVKEQIPGLRTEWKEVDLEIATLEKEAKDAQDEAAIQQVSEKFEALSKGRVSRFRVSVIQFNGQHVVTQEHSDETIARAKQMVAELDALKDRADMAEKHSPLQEPATQEKVSALRKSGAEMRTFIISKLESLTKENAAQTHTEIMDLMKGGFAEFQKGVEAVSASLQTETPVGAPDSAPAEGAEKSEPQKEEAPKAKPVRAGLGIE